MVDLKGYSYSPARQPIVDKARLRYNEWIAQADGAFGQFMAMLTEAGHLRNTAVIVSADHGESFAGGYVGHGGPEQRRPILHVPLIIHLPGQRRGAIDTRVADQTALAPTILQLAGGATPEWMEGRPLLSSEGGKPTEAAEQPSAAFAQFLEPNSVFAPVRRGTLGVIDGRSQYVLTLDSGAGALYDLADSDRQDHDRSHAEPEQVARLHGEIARKFPSLIGERA
jgi:arylsulfatase A-like enzyme